MFLIGLFAISGYSEKASGVFFGGFGNYVLVVFVWFPAEVSRKNPPNPRFEGPNPPINPFKGPNKPARCLIRFFARVLTRVWGREKTILQCTILPGLEEKTLQIQETSKSVKTTSEINEMLHFPSSKPWSKTWPKIWSKLAWSENPRNICNTGLGTEAGL